MGDYADNTELPTFWDFPLYKQLHNACGLASILMLVNPKKDERIHNFLTEMSHQLSPILQKISPEFDRIAYSYQFVLEYILLKAQTNNAPNFKFLYEYLATRFKEAYEDQKTLNNYILTTKREKFIEMDKIEYAKAYDRYILEGDIVPAIMLEDETHTQKTDIELKLLLEILGYRFISVKTGDPIGAVSLNAQNQQENFNLLCQAFIDPKFRIIFGYERHWTAVEGLYPENMKHWRLKHGKLPEKPSIKEFSIILNDPITPDQVTYKITELDPNGRFYFFENRNENLKWLWDQMVEATQKDIHFEISETNRILRRYDSEGFDLSDGFDISDEELDEIVAEISKDEFVKPEIRAQDEIKTQHVIDKYTAPPFKIKVHDVTKINIPLTEPEDKKESKSTISEKDIFEN